MKKMMLVAGLLLSLSVQGLEVGDAAPEFSAKNQDGVDWVLAEHLSKKPVVVYFYPAAMTGGIS